MHGLNRIRGHQPPNDRMWPDLAGFPGPRDVRFRGMLPRALHNGMRKIDPQPTFARSEDLG